jgi:hypothetical protein
VKKYSDLQKQQTTAAPITSPGRRSPLGPRSIYCMLVVSEYLPVPIAMKYKRLQGVSRHNRNSSIDFHNGFFQAINFD